MFHNSSGTLLARQTLVQTTCLFLSVCLSVCLSGWLPVSIPSLCVHLARLSFLPTLFVRLLGAPVPRVSQPDSSLLLHNKRTWLI